MGEAFDPADARSFAGHRRRLDSAPLRFQRHRRHRAAELREAIIRSPDCRVRTSYGAGLAAIFCAVVQRKAAERIRPDRERFRLPRLGRIVSRHRMDDGRSLPADRSRLPSRTLSRFRHADHGNLFFLVLPVAGTVVRPGTVRPRLLRCGRYAHADGRGHSDHQRIVADLFADVPQVWRGRAGLCFRYWHWSEFVCAGSSVALPETGIAGNASLG